MGTTQDKLEALLRLRPHTAKEIQKKAKIKNIQTVYNTISRLEKWINVKKTYEIDRKKPGKPKLYYSV